MSSATPVKFGGRRRRRLHAKYAGKRSATSSKHHFRGGSRVFKWVARDSPLSAANLSDSPRLKRPRTSSIPISINDSPPVDNEAESDPEFVIPLMEDAPTVERRWRAVLIVIMRESKQNNLSLSRKQYDELALECSVGSGRSLERYVKNVKEGIPLTPKKPSGRRPLVLEQVATFMIAVAAQFGYSFTTEVMATRVSAELNVGSPSTIRRALKAKKWTKTRQSSRPYLTPENQQVRYSFCRQWLHVVTTDVFWRIHIDEKWFFAFPKGRVLYCPPGVIPPLQRLTHKNHIPKVMFLGAIGEPTVLFDGSVGIWPVVKMHTPKRASELHPRVNGELVPYLKSATMDASLFVEMIETKLIPAIIERAQRVLNEHPDYRLTVYTQLDNAGGHGVGTSVDILNEKGANAHPRIRIHFHCQPPNSPDLNVLDLGAWYSIQKAVPSLVYDPSVPKSSLEDRIITTVQESFTAWNARAKCADLFQTLRAFQCEVIESEGNNLFKQPHTRGLEARVNTLAPTLIPLPPLQPIPAPPAAVIIRISVPHPIRLILRFSNPALP